MGYSTLSSAIVPLLLFLLSCAPYSSGFAAAATNSSSGNPTASSACNTSATRNALIAFFHVTQGWQWFDNTNWSTSADVADWFGVTCSSSSSSSGNVSVVALEVNLTFNGLNGSLATALSSLSKAESPLRVLDLSRNTLTGSVSWQPLIAALPSLSVLNLGYNELEGTLPSQIDSTSPLQPTFFSQLKSLQLCSGANFFCRSNDETLSSSSSSSSSSSGSALTHIIALDPQCGRATPLCSETCEGFGIPLCGGGGSSRFQRVIPQVEITATSSSTTSPSSRTVFEHCCVDGYRVVGGSQNTLAFATTTSSSRESPSFSLVLITGQPPNGFLLQLVNVTVVNLPYVVLLQSTSPLSDIAVSVVDSRLLSFHTLQTQFSLLRVEPSVSSIRNISVHVESTRMDGQITMDTTNTAQNPKCDCKTLGVILAAPFPLSIDGLTVVVTRVLSNITVLYGVSGYPLYLAWVQLIGERTSRHSLRTINVSIDTSQFIGTTVPISDALSNGTSVSIQAVNIDFNGFGALTSPVIDVVIFIRHSNLSFRCVRSCGVVLLQQAAHIQGLIVVIEDVHAIMVAEGPLLLLTQAFRMAFIFWVSNTTVYSGSIRVSRVTAALNISSTDLLTLHYSSSLVQYAITTSIVMTESMLNSVIVVQSVTVKSTHLSSLEIPIGTLIFVLVRQGSAIAFRGSPVVNVTITLRTVSFTTVMSGSPLKPLPKAVLPCVNADISLLLALPRSTTNVVVNMDNSSLTTALLDGTNDDDVLSSEKLKRGRTAALLSLMSEASSFSAIFSGPFAILAMPVLASGSSVVIMDRLNVTMRRVRLETLTPSLVVDLNVLIIGSHIKNSSIRIDRAFVYPYRVADASIAVVGFTNSSLTDGTQLTLIGVESARAVFAPVFTLLAVESSLPSTILVVDSNVTVLDCVIGGGSVHGKLSTFTSSTTTTTDTTGGGGGGASLQRASLILGKVDAALLNNVTSTRSFWTFVNCVVLVVVPPLLPSGATATTSTVSLQATPYPAYSIFSSSTTTFYEQNSVVVSCTRILNRGFGTSSGAERGSSNLLPVVGSSSSLWSDADHKDDAVDLFFLSRDTFPIVSPPSPSAAKTVTQLLIPCVPPVNTAPRESPSAVEMVADSMSIAALIGSVAVGDASGALTIQLMAVIALADECGSSGQRPSPGIARYTLSLLYDYGWEASVVFNGLLSISVWAAQTAAWRLVVRHQAGSTRFSAQLRVRYPAMSVRAFIFLAAGLCRGSSALLISPRITLLGSVVAFFGIATFGSGVYALIAVVQRNYVLKGMRYVPYQQSRMMASTAAMRQRIVLFFLPDGRWEPSAWLQARGYCCFNARGEHRLRWAILLPLTLSAATCMILSIPSVTSGATGCGVVWIVAACSYIAYTAVLLKVQPGRVPANAAYSATSSLSMATLCLYKGIELLVSTTPIPGGGGVVVSLCSFLVTISCVASLLNALVVQRMERKRNVGAEGEEPLELQQQQQSEEASASSWLSSSQRSSGNHKRNRNWVDSLGFSSAQSSSKVAPVRVTEAQQEALKSLVALICSHTK